MTGAWASCPISRRASAWPRLRREVFEQKPDVEGLILHKHGIFTFGETAREAYERMIEMVSLAESRLRQGRPVRLPGAAARRATAAAARDRADHPRRRAPSSTSGAEPTRFIADFRTAPEILDYVNGAELASYSQRGVVTPDHIIRTKNRPLVVPPPEAGKLDDFAARCARGRGQVRRRIRCLFRPRERSRWATPRPSSIGSPRVVLVPGVGLFGLGRTAKDAAHRRRPRREHGQGGHRRRGHRPLRAAAGERSVRARILEPRAGEAERRGGQAAHRPGRVGDRRRRDRRGDREGACRRRRRGRHCSISTARRRRRPPPRSRASVSTAT